jgi:LacI family transcriptional regulator
MSTRRITLLDVARAAGVSITTVSRVINAGPNVREDVRARVQAAVDDLRYEPNAVARSLRSGRDATIGVIVDSLADAFFATFCHAIEQAAVERGLAVAIGTSGRDPERDAGLVRRFLQRQVAGLVLVPVGDSPAYLASLRRSTPTVFADRSVTPDAYDTVLGDDLDGAIQATRHLLAHGHRRIAFVGDSTSVHTSRTRLDGYRRAMADAGAEVDGRLVVTGCSEPNEAEAVARGWLAATDGPTAVFSSNLRCTTGLVRALHAEDRTDVAVVGFGDFPLADVLSPAVTVIDQDPHHLGVLCAERLLARLDGDTTEPETTVLPVRLIARGSGEIPCVRS